MFTLYSPIKYKLSSSEVEMLLYILEEKIKEVLPIEGPPHNPKNTLVFNYLVKVHLNTLRIRVRSQYERNRQLTYKISLNPSEALSFFAACRFGGKYTGEKSMLCYKISSLIDPKL